MQSGPRALNGTESLESLGNKNRGMAVSGAPFLWLASTAQPAGGSQSSPVECWKGAWCVGNRRGAQRGMVEHALPKPLATASVGEPAPACGPGVGGLRASHSVSATHGSKGVQWEGLLRGGVVGIGAFGAIMILPDMASAVEASAGGVGSQFTELLAREPANALSLPTWTIHVASVAEWVTAMSLVWQYGGTPGNAAWKGLAWGMVPLLGGAMCACTWHFFYNSDSLADLVVLQGALTLIGNFTMWIAAFRIYLAAQENPTAP